MSSMLYILFFSSDYIRNAAITSRPMRNQGQFVTTANGVEGSLVYALPAALSDLPRTSGLGRKRTSE